jgi:hypothetical protein
MPEDWRLTKPIPLDSIELVLHRLRRRWSPVTTRRPGRCALWSRRNDATTATTKRDLDRLRLFQNRVCYRLLGVERMPAPDAATLTFEHMRYFDMIDVGEALAHELARTYLNLNGALRTDQPSSAHRGTHGPKPLLTRARSGQPISSRRRSRISQMTSWGIGLASVKRIVPLDRS